MMPSQPPQSGDGPEGPYPSVPGALMLTLMAVFASGFTGVAFIDFGMLAAVGIGRAIGLGAVATMGAQRVPEPQAERLGLRRLDWDAIPLILCLLPAILLASEMDNFATDWSGGPGATTSQTLEAGEEAAAPDYSTYEDAQAERIAREAEANTRDAAETPVAGELAADEESPPSLVDVDDLASVLQAFVVFVGITPLVEEFLFFGVIQQGLLQRLGLFRGLSVVALLWTLLRPAPVGGVSNFLAAAVASFLLGWTLGLVRLATRSILGPILLASGWAAIGLTASVYADRLPLPGMNVAGTHLPVTVTLASLGIVAWAGRTIFQEAQLRLAEDESDKPDPPKTPPTNLVQLRPPKRDD